jgi:hypothetical protein
MSNTSNYKGGELPRSRSFREILEQGLDEARVNARLLYEQDPTIASVAEDLRFLEEQAKPGIFNYDPDPLDTATIKNDRQCVQLIGEYAPREWRELEEFYNANMEHFGMYGPPRLAPPQE